ncbi:MAG: LytR/AlgR family response regulator transcription factor [Lewinella sp.]|jgi:DNA-binding LytR/AlgR family response regulator|uniref:LytR/AlgR family response regulator transcription factor n=1 Tax=Lewinella sp. TaxID=2004506 RepID=UPI003D6B2F18
MTPKTTKILLVDDEYLALNLLESYVQQVPGTRLIAKCKSALEAMEVLRQEEVDIMFLDIQMPSLSGVDFLKGLEKRPATVFTTAYKDYAIDAFNLNAVDYLLKPFSFPRFLQALQKGINHQQKGEEKDAAITYLPIKVDGKLVRVKISEIVYVEGMKEYVRIVCENNKYVTFERMKNMENLLPTAQFMRVHKSYLIARQKVTSIEGNLLEVGGAKIPVSRSLRSQIIEELFC